MRKEVKLGMVIGSGLIALLVVYLLVAPPNPTKKGAGLANGDPAYNAGGTGGSEVGVPGDLATDDQGGARSIVSAPAGESTGGNEAIPKPNTLTPDPKADAVASAKPTAGTPSGTPAGGAEWNNRLNNGASTGAEARGSARTGVAGRSTELAHPAGADRTLIASDTPARATSRDPNAAWGDGVSNDAPALGSIRSGGRAHLMASGAVAPAPVMPTAAVGAARTHAIQPGETLSSIAASAYGSAMAYTHILKANPNLNPTNLKIGTVITLPAIEQIKAANERKAAAPASPGGSTSGTLVDVKIDPTRQYKVQSGDSLYRIAARLYGKGIYADRIYDRNRALIGGDPKRLKLGIVLELPEQPTAGSHNNTTTANTPASASPADVNASILQTGEAK